MKSVRRYYLECDASRPVPEELNKWMKVHVRKWDTPTSKVLKFPQGLLKEAAPRPEVELGIQSSQLEVQRITFGLIYYFQICICCFPATGLKFYVHCLMQDKQKAIRWNNITEIFFF